ncbi:serine/threonine-protein kinase [Amycolatopsis magusensis]|uniref:non-specific serine/threonine protein kinase n=1 Tax=Amycolatopsis magusensis TaxID=882444 RepID=A0ABS4PU93_9PSEU|nr:serine/threonine-protein kinase [Amycolatopsis magusensis]MBP2183001.1 serine/threonine-protein kinase PknG [Amycolatopsis magusensis]
MSAGVPICHGLPVGPNGFCDVCGHSRVATGTEVKPVVPSSQRRGTDSDLVGDSEFRSLPTVETPDPATLVLTDPKVPVDHQFCGRCGAEVGRPYRGQPALRAGFCEEDGEPFDFRPKLAAGELVGGQYQVLGCLAHGGLGWVYLATDTHLPDKYVVLKGVIDRHNAGARRLAQVERDVLTRLDHPNIVRIVDFVAHPGRGADGDDEYLVMDYVGGLSLREVLKHPELLRVEHVITYGRAILSALDYLHGENLLYVDMTPNNVIHGDKRVKVIDLGATRAIDDRDSVPVLTPGYRVSEREHQTHGLTVRSDVYSVGCTLRTLLDATPGASAAEVGTESLDLVITRATDDYERRFTSAAEMSEQLDGVRREVLFLRPRRSVRFENTPELLDAGLGTVPGLAYWTERDPVLGSGLPEPRVAASKLPLPQPDALDDAVEVELTRARARIELHDPRAADQAIGRAKELLGPGAEQDWRIAWHLGLLHLAEGDGLEPRKAAQAKSRFEAVRKAWPAEDAPKLALGYCAEVLGDRVEALRLYQNLWARDDGQVSAAFGLARCLLGATGKDEEERREHKEKAIAALDEVPGISRHYDAARIAVVRLRVAAPVSQADLEDVAKRLPELFLDNESLELLTTLVRHAALEYLRGGGAGGWHGGELFGAPVTEHGLRKGLEKSFRRIAGQARDEHRYGDLVDRANEVRPLTLR